VTPGVRGSERLVVLVDRRGSGQRRRSARPGERLHRCAEAEGGELLGLAGARPEARAPQEPLGLTRAERARVDEPVRGRLRGGDGLRGGRRRGSRDRGGRGGRGGLGGGLGSQRRRVVAMMRAPATMHSTAPAAAVDRGGGDVVLVCPAVEAHPQRYRPGAPAP